MTDEPTTPNPRTPQECLDALNELAGMDVLRLDEMEHILCGVAERVRDACATQLGTYAVVVSHERAVVVRECAKLIKAIDLAAAIKGGGNV